MSENPLWSRDGDATNDGREEVESGNAVATIPSDVHEENPPAADETVPVRVCRKCSTQSRGTGEFCAFCGARFSRRSLSRRAKTMFAVVVLLLAGGAAAAIIVKANHDSQVKAEQHRKAVASQQAAARQRGAAAARQRAAAAEKKVQQTIQIDERKALVEALQQSVTKDAQKDVDNGLLDGASIIKTECTPVGGGNLQDTLADHTGNWSCLAVNSIGTDGTDSGYGFSATINYDTGSYTWRLGNAG